MKRMWVLSLLVGILAMGAVQPDRGDQPVTVGDFAIQMASSLKLDMAATGARDAIALRSLNEAGIQLNGDPDQLLRQGDIVDVLSQFGYDVFTSTPKKTVPSDDLFRLMGLFELQEDNDDSDSDSDSDDDSDDETDDEDEEDDTDDEDEEDVASPSE